MLTCLYLPPFFLQPVTCPRQRSGGRRRRVENVTCFIHSHLHPIRENCVQKGVRTYPVRSAGQGLRGALPITQGSNLHCTASICLTTTKSNRAMYRLDIQEYYPQIPILLLVWYFSKIVNGFSLHLTQQHNNGLLVLLQKQGDWERGQFGNRTCRIAQKDQDYSAGRREGG